MNRPAIAARLSLMVAAAGLVPIAAVGIIGINLLRHRVQRASQQALEAVAEQAAARIEGFVSHQVELVRAIAAVATEPGAKRRLEEVVLEAPSLGRVGLLSQDSPEAERPRALGVRDLSQVFAGNEVRSEVYLASDTTPAVDVCVPARWLPRQAVCAQLDLLELWRFVQRIHVGTSGYALTFNDAGRLLASGAGSLRKAILSGELVPESPFAIKAASDAGNAPTQYLGPDGEPVIAGWARLPHLGWTIVAEQPLREALRSARTAQWVLGAVLVVALFISVAVGVWQSQRVLRDLAIEERWRTAGRIASGITHDLGHRLRILEQTAELAENGDPGFLPRIRDNLRAEVATLRKFVAEFLDLSRDVRSIELLPLDLGAFLESVRRTAGPHADLVGIRLDVLSIQAGLWSRADRYLLERAVINLVSNAIEASPKGGTVGLSVLREGPACEIQVADRGSGIAPDRLPHLFDTFASTKSGGGPHLGMGLPNVKRIVEAHGGKVSAVNRSGGGTIFRIRLPEVPPPEMPKS